MAASEQWLCNDGVLGPGQVFMRKRSLLGATLEIRLDPVPEAFALEKETGREDDMLSAPRLPPESLVLSDLLMKISHPERSGAASSLCLSTLLQWLSRSRQTNHH